MQAASSEGSSGWSTTAAQNYAALSHYVETGEGLDEPQAALGGNSFSQPASSDFSPGISLLAGAGVGSLLAGPSATSIMGANTLTRYVGPIEAQIAQDTGLIPNTYAGGALKSIFVTPEAPIASATQAETMYGIGALNPAGPMPHRVTLSLAIQKEFRSITPALTASRGLAWR